MGELTHLDESGQARMVDVGAKAETQRERPPPTRPDAAETLRLLRAGDLPKGDVLGAARIAGIMAANATHELIPCVIPCLLTAVAVEFDYDEDASPW